MRGNVVVAAAVFGVAVIVASLVLVIGLARVGQQFDESVRAHAAATQGAGNQVGRSAQDGFGALVRAVEQHGQAVVRSGETISKPNIRIESPVAIEQPVTVRGPRDDGGLPINARIQK